MKRHDSSRRGSNKYKTIAIIVTTSNEIMSKEEIRQTDMRARVVFAFSHI